MAHILASIISHAAFPLFPSCGFVVVLPPPPLVAVSLYSCAIYSLLDEFHAKHGRHRGGEKGGKPRKNSVSISDTPDSVVAVRQRNNNDIDGLNRNQDRDLSKTAGENRKQKDDKVGTPLPAISPSLPAVPERNTDGAAGAVGRRSMFVSDEDIPESTADSSRSVGGHGESTVTFPTQVTPLHICVCCGAEGGLGHGRRCTHAFRRCGFCRVEEVRRVLGIQDIGRRTRRGTSTSVSKGCCALN